MPTGGTHLFPVSYSSSALSSSLPFLTTSRVNVVLPVSVKSSFSVFVSDCFTSQRDVKLWWINLVFLCLAFFVIMRLWVIDFSVPVEELVPLQVDFLQSLLCLVLRPLILLLFCLFWLVKIVFRCRRRSHCAMILSIWVLMMFLWRQGTNVTILWLLESAPLYQNQENLMSRIKPGLTLLITCFW